MPVTARVDRGVGVVITESHKNRTAFRGWMMLVRLLGFLNDMLFVL